MVEIRVLLKIEDINIVSFLIICKKPNRLTWSAGLFIVSVLPNGGEQSITTEVDSKTYGHFKDSYGPPENFVG